jgi:hypothetical protein
MAGLVAQNLQGGGGTGQTIEIQSSTGGYVVAGTGTSPYTGSILNANIATLMTALSADITAQLEAAGPLGIMQGWPNGNP